jgi:Domain of unknown function (DUF4157)
MRRRRVEGRAGGRPAGGSGTAAGPDPASALAGLQRAVGNRGMRPLLGGGSPVVQRKCAACEEEEKSSDADQAIAPAAAPETAAPVPEPAGPEPAGPEAAGEEPAAPQAARGALLVEDDVAEPGPGRMRKSDFLAELRAAVCETVDAGLAGTGRTSDDCPWVDYWFGVYAEQDAGHVERALGRFAPETAAAATAPDLIPLLAARVRRSVDAWARTGEVNGLPDGVPADLPAQPAEGGGILAKARAGGARAAGDPEAIRGQLGGGQPLPGGTRNRMESAFGVGFGAVRLHTDAGAARLSDRLNARAFTVGRDVAFGSGEYRPGTPVGDALLAHELAHVVQQGSGRTSSPGPHRAGDDGVLEHEADRSAAGAVAALWGGAKAGLANVAGRAAPAARSGLRLSRCKKGGTSEAKKICVRPILVANDDGTAPTTLPSFDAAKRIWKKCCIEVEEQGATTVKGSAYKEIDDAGPGAPLTAEETALFAAAGAGGGCVQVAIVGTIRRGANAGRKVAGGATTKDGGKADAKVIGVDGIDPVVVAHELGHAMGYLRHDPAGTVMEPSGDPDTPNPETMDPTICTDVRNFTGATATGDKSCKTST